MDIAAMSLGLSIAALAVSIAAILKKPKDPNVQEWKVNIPPAPGTAKTARKQKPQGFIVEPESEADQARQALIEKNRKLGKDTPLTDLEYEDT